MSNFQKPRSGWLCFFSILWIVVAVYLGILSVRTGKMASLGVAVVFCVAAAGLWFQSRMAAWILIVLASAGTIYTLFQIGQVHWTRTGFRLCYGIYSVVLLWEYLRGQRTD